MFKFHVDDLDKLLVILAEEGISQIGETLVLSYGKFARISDPENNQIELWQPAEGF